MFNIHVIKNYPPALKLLSLVFITFTSMLFVTMIGMLIASVIFGKDIITQFDTINSITDKNSLLRLQYFQIVGQLGFLIVPVIIYSLLVTDKPSSYLSANRSSNFTIYIFGISLIIFTLPFINFLSELNLMLSLPESMSAIEQWIKQSEDQAKIMTDSFLSVDYTGGFLINLFMIAIIPAIGEEFLFRGIIQRIFRELTKNKHLAVILTAFIFSAIHFQFYGFIPRFFLGLVLGYIMIWSGSIWVPVAVHFVNNAFAVTIAFLNTKNIITADYETFGSTDNIWIIIISIITTSMMCYLLWLRREKFKESNFADKTGNTEVL